MPLNEFLIYLYLWADSHALDIVLASVAWAMVGTALARIGKYGQTEQDGQAIANIVIGGAVLWMLLSAMALGVAHVGFKKGMFDANVLLLVAPLLCVAGSVVGIHWVFPLSSLATVRTLRDVCLFALACALGIWLLSKFRGWGVMFIGGIGELVVIAVMAVALLRVLYRRAFGHDR